MSSVPDYWNNDYFDDTYEHNGRMESYRGYCTDIWFDEAMAWMQACARRKKPFFTYLATNAPHSPLFVGDDFRADYGSVDKALASYFGMISCIDHNMGRLEAMLAESGLADNTILIWMTDNGGTVGVPFYNARMRGRKTSLYEGGHRVPCFIRWPQGRLREAGDVSAATQVQDILPTLVDLCSLELPVGACFDGTSLAGLLSGGQVDDRVLVVQYGARAAGPIETEWLGDPVKWESAVVWNQWRLVQGQELYDIVVDVGQNRDVAGENPDVADRMRTYYEKWWAQIESQAFEFVRIPIGASEAPEVCLTSHTWLKTPVTLTYERSEQGNVRFGPRRNGPWNIRVEQAGRYRISLRRWPKEANSPMNASVPEYEPRDATHGPFIEGVALPVAAARIHVAGLEASHPVCAGQKSAEFDLDLPAGDTRLISALLDSTGRELCGAYYAYVSRLG